MIRRPPRSTLSSSSAASDVYKRQVLGQQAIADAPVPNEHEIKERGDGNRPLGADVIDIEHPQLVALVGDNSEGGDREPKRRELSPEPMTKHGATRPGARAPGRVAPVSY